MEVHAFGGRWQAYGRNLEHIEKWRMFAEVNQGVIAIVGPNSAVEDALNCPVAQPGGRGPPHPAGDEHLAPGEDWTRTIFRK